VIRDAEGAHLPRSPQLIERLGDVLGLDQSIGPVQEKQVEVVGVERLERRVHRGDDVLRRVVEVRPVGDDARLGLDDHGLALGGGELHGLGEAHLAAVQGRAVHVGVVHDGDARVEGGAHQSAHLLVGLVLNAHQPEHHVGCRDVDAGEVVGLHVSNLSVRR